MNLLFQNPTELSLTCDNQLRFLEEATRREDRQVIEFYSNPTLLEETLRPCRFSETPMQWVDDLRFRRENHMVGIYFPAL